MTDEQLDLACKAKCKIERLRRCVELCQLEGVEAVPWDLVSPHVQEKCERLALENLRGQLDEAVAEFKAL